MIKFEPPPRGLRAWLRRFRRRDWRAELEALDRRTRLEIGRALTRSISDLTTRAELEEKLNQVEGQLQEKKFQ